MPATRSPTPQSNVKRAPRRRGSVGSVAVRGRWACGGILGGGSSDVRRVPRRRCSRDVAVLTFRAEIRHAQAHILEAGSEYSGGKRLEADHSDTKLLAKAKRAGGGCVCRTGWRHVHGLVGPTKEPLSFHCNLRGAPDSVDVPKRPRLWRSDRFSRAQQLLTRRAGHAPLRRHARRRGQC
eukprot:2771241-Prymnesium_polylepis.3